MKYLVFRIPTSLRLAKKYQLNNKTVLVPAGKFSQKLGFSTRFCDSFWYVEEVSTDLNLLPLKNLKEFIRFWSFVFSENLAITHFETGEEYPHFANTIPDETSEIHEGQAPVDLLPDNIKLKVELVYTSTPYNLADIFLQFVNSNKETRDLIELYSINPGKYCSYKSIYNNYFFKSSINSIILDALTSEDRCESQISCPKDCKNSEGNNLWGLKHPKTPYKQRIRNLLEPFEDKEVYVKICYFFYEKRNEVFHKGYSGSKPKTNMPYVDPITKIGQREATIEETVQDLKNEGLSADNAQSIFNGIIYTLLMNKLFPDLNLWPKFTMLKMTTIGSVWQ